MLVKPNRRHRAAWSWWRVSAVPAIIAAALLSWPAQAAAHGVGGRTDLPIPAWQLAWAASFAVAASFVALGMFWETPKLDAASQGKRLPTVVQRILGALAVLARPVGLALVAIVLYAGLWGNVNPFVNIAPVAVYILFWVGLQVVSVLVTDVWRGLSPFQALADGAAWARSRLSGHEMSAADHGSGNQWWAVAAVFSFVWLELAYHDSGEPRVLGAYFAVYTVAMLVGAAVWGRGWVRDAEGFGVLFTKLAAISPLYRPPARPPGDQALSRAAEDSAGSSPGEQAPPRSAEDSAGESAGLPGGEQRWRLRMPLAGLAALPATPGAVAFIMVVLGSTTFDGMTRSSFWLNLVEDQTGWGRTVYSTVGLVFVILAVFVLYRAAISVMAALTGDHESELSELFAPSLLPIAAAYTIAHYFSYLLLEGQQVIAHISDPFGRGWDIFGTATYLVDYTVISTDTIAWVQTAAIAVGHVLAVAVAHDFAVARWSRQLAVRSQYPMLAVMIAYTIIGLLLLLGA